MQFKYNVLLTWLQKKFLPWNELFIANVSKAKLSEVKYGILDKLLHFDKMLNNRIF